MNKQEKLNAFISQIAKNEAGKTQSNIGDIRQVMRLVNKELDGMLYKLIELKMSPVEDGWKPVED